MSNSTRQSAANMQAKMRSGVTTLLAPALLLLVLLLSFFCGISSAARSRGSSSSGGRDAKFLSMFQIVTFPNDRCNGTDSKFGTCYTSDECSSKGGTSSGSCASGYGVCCSFTKNCGASLAENNTYFESAGGEVGQCTMQICKCSTNICQLRLDFETFTISGPSTATLTSGKAANADTTTATQCLDDTFIVTSPGSAAPPVLCGDVTNDHMYVDASDACNDLTFAIGTNSATRSWSIRVTQFDCGFENLAPSGCTQYFYDTSGTGTIRSYNFNSGTHLANQRQRICIRRERGNCQICYSGRTGITTDFELSNSAGNAIKGKAGFCCGYMTTGQMSTFDCLVIPSASGIKVAAMPMSILTFSRFCGSGVDFSAAAMFATQASSICSQRLPFEVTFISDDFEFTMEAMAGQIQAGFMLNYEQNSQNC